MPAVLFVGVTLFAAFVTVGVFKAMNDYSRFKREYGDRKYWSKNKY